MKKFTTYLVPVLLSTTMLGSAFASKDDDNKMRNNYQEHYQQRHQMNMDMMQMLSETMTVLRDLNHKPSAEEKARLDQMINQLDKIMATHKKMGGMMMQKDTMRGRNMMMREAEDGSSN